jgi:acyl-CoA thioesterase FadM
LQLHGGKLWTIEKCTKQNALTVERTAKYLSNLHKANQLDVKTVLRRTNHKEVLVVAAIEDSAVTIADSTVAIVGSETTDQKKCTKQNALTVERTAKYLSNLHKANQLDVKIVSKHQETN